MFFYFIFRLVASGGARSSAVFLQSSYRCASHSLELFSAFSLPCSALRSEMNSALMETADLYAEDGPSFILPALASSYLFLFIIQLGVGLMKDGNESAPLFS